MTTQQYTSRKWLMILAFIISSFALQGQERSASEISQGGSAKMYGGFGYFMMGYHVPDLKEMNSQLTDAGYPDMGTGSVSIGGGGHYLVKNWLIGGEGAGLPGVRVENDAYIVNHAGGYGFFDLGYLVWRTPSFFLYPVLGIGGGGMTVNLKEKAGQTTSFPAILDTPGREVNLENGGFLLNLSLLANYMVWGEKSSGTSGGFILGVKAGYILNLSGNSWSQNSETLNNSPASGISGPYVSLVIGGGGMVSNK